MSTEDGDTDAQTGDWTFGDACPECGSRTVNYTERLTRRLVPDGDGGVEDCGVLHAEGCEAVCGGCGAFLGTEVTAETVN